MVQGDRLQEHADRAVNVGGGDAGPQHRRSVVTAGWHGDDQARDVAQHGDCVVVVEMPAEALLVGQARHSHHHGIAKLPGGEELQAGRLAA